MRRVVWILCSLMLSLLGGIDEAIAMDEASVSLSVGEQHSLTDVRGFSVERPEIVRAEMGKEPNTLILRGLRGGRSKVMYQTGVGKDNKLLDITVASRSAALIKQEVEPLLRNFNDITLRVQGNLVILEGSVGSEKEMQQVREIERRYDGQVSNLVTVGVSGQRRNMMVRLDLHYVQVRRRLQRNLGMRYPQSIKLGNIVNFTLDKLIPTSAVMGAASPITQQSLVSDLLPSLDLNESSGYVKVMRTDTIITENGAKAIYKDGAEAVIRLTGSLGAGTIERVFYGAELALVPRLTASNEAVSLEISADISQRDSAASVDNIPGRLIDHVQTNVHIPLGQSVMLAGVDLKTTGRTTSGLPWLNRIPVLGYLFGSEGKDSESAYGVLYITPTLIQNASNATKAQVDTALQYFENPQSLPR